MQPDFRKRVRNLQKLIKENKLDSVLLTSQSDILYYTGFELDDSAFLVIDKNSGPVLFVSPLNNDAENLKTAEVRFLPDLKKLAEFLKKYRKVGFDERSLNVHAFSRLKSRVSMKPANSFIKNPRMVKDEYEKKQIERAAKITLEIFRGIRIKNRTELEVAAEIENKISCLGLQKAFPPIMSSGKNSYLIHTRPKNKRIKGNDLVILDIGVKCNGYCSDIARTLCLNPNIKQKGIFENVKHIQREIISNIRDGIGYDKLEKIYESLMKKHGYKVFHSFGHGVGLSPHERPFKGDTLREGMVLTVEPGVYIKGFGGCRIEDMILVKKGKAKILSEFKRRLEEPLP